MLNLTLLDKHPLAWSMNDLIEYLNIYMQSYNKEAFIANLIKHEISGADLFSMPLTKLKQINKNLKEAVIECIYNDIVLPYKVTFELPLNPMRWTSSQLQTWIMVQPLMSGLKKAICNTLDTNIPELHSNTYIENLIPEIFNVFKLYDAYISLEVNFEQQASKFNMLANPRNQVLVIDFINKIHAGEKTTLIYDDTNYDAKYICKVTAIREIWHLDVEKAIYNSKIVQIPENVVHFIGHYTCPTDTNLSKCYANYNASSYNTYKFICTHHQNFWNNKFFNLHANYQKISMKMLDGTLEQEISQLSKPYNLSPIAIQKFIKWLTTQQLYHKILFEKVFKDKYQDSKQSKNMLLMLYQGHYSSLLSNLKIVKQLRTKCMSAIGGASKSLIPKPHELLYLYENGKLHITTSMPQNIIKVLFNYYNNKNIYQKKYPKGKDLHNLNNFDSIELSLHIMQDKQLQVLGNDNIHQLCHYILHYNINGNTFLDHCRKQDGHFEMLYNVPSWSKSVLNQSDAISKGHAIKLRLSQMNF